MSDISTEKKVLRRQLRDTLKKMDSEALRVGSLMICHQLAEVIECLGFRHIGIFAARPREVDLLPLLDMLPDRAWYFPLVHKERLMSFHLVRSAAELKTGSWNIREPSSLAAEIRVCDLDLIILPGLAFSKDGGRMGYGGGFYDTTLATLSDQTSLYGVCFTCQMVESVPTEPHDLPVHAVFSA